jgi:hypothetical protein
MPSLNSYLIAGCTYIANGKYIGKDLVLTVKQLLLPTPPKTK